jgi:proteasome lid subunit RPN8/RPN11
MSSHSRREDSPSGQALRLPLDEMGRLHDHVVEGYPHEVVGVLAGERASGTVRALRPLVNERADQAATRYAVSALALHRAEAALEADGHEILGYYHSHPDHPAAWSDTDRDEALPNTVYLIAAVAGPAGPSEAPRLVDLRAWRLRDDRSTMDADHLILTTP